VLALSERSATKLLAYRIAPAALIEIVPLGLELDRLPRRRPARGAPRPSASHREPWRSWPCAGSCL